MRQVNTVKLADILFSLAVCLCVCLCATSVTLTSEKLRTLLHSCAEVRIAIELSFGVVSGVSPCIDVLDGGPRASRGRGCF